MAERVSPHDLDAERSILGAVLVNNATYTDVSSMALEAFFREGHRRTFRQIRVLAERGDPIDLVTLKSVLESAGDLEECGGPAYLASLTDGVPLSTNVPYYRRIVEDRAAARAAIDVLTRTVNELYTNPSAIGNGLPRQHIEAFERITGRVEHPATRTGHLFTTAIETCQNIEASACLLEPIIYQGAIASLVAKIKVGKTSLALAAAWCGRHSQGFVGFAPPRTKFRTLYLTEQPRASFAKQLIDAGLQKDDGVVVSYFASWKGRPWAEIVQVVIETAIRESTELIVIDTGSKWFGFKGDEENQAGAADAVTKLNPFVDQGGSVLILRHGRKSGGTLGDAGRGSSAIDGAVDVILHMHQPSGAPPDTREIEAGGRFDIQSPIRLRRKLQHHQPIEIGSDDVYPAFTFERIDRVAEDGKPRDRVYHALTKGKRTVAQLAEELGVSDQTIKRAIEELSDRIVICGKTGPRNNANVYGIKENSPSQSLRDGDVEVSEMAGARA